MDDGLEVEDGDPLGVAEGVGEVEVGVAVGVGDPVGVGMDEGTPLGLGTFGVNGEEPGRSPG